MTSVKVLFVCSGNTCRSVMALGLLRKMWEQYSNEIDLIIESAGVYAFPGSPASKNALKVLTEYEVDVSDHQARQIDLEILREADLIMVMTGHHRDALVSLFPEVQEKIKLFREFNENEGDVPDPFGGTEEDYRRVAEFIYESLEHLIRYLLNLR